MKLAETLLNLVDEGDAGLEGDLAWLDRRGGVIGGFGQIRHIEMGRAIWV